jgi:hypothetical protein
LQGSGGTHLTVWEWVRKAQVKEHRKAGLLCKMEKDADADAEFTAALKLMGK